MAEGSLLFTCLLLFLFLLPKTTCKIQYYLTIYKAHTRALSCALADLYILTFRGTGSFILHVKFNSFYF